MRRGVIAIVLFLAIATVLTAASFQCPAPQMALGTTYDQIKVACQDIGVQAVQRIEPDIAVYYCPSQSALVLGSMRTGKVVGLMVINYDPRVSE